METHHAASPGHGTHLPSWLEHIEDVSLPHNISKSWNPMAGLRCGDDPIPATPQLKADGILITFAHPPGR